MFSLSLGIIVQTPSLASPQNDGAAGPYLIPFRSGMNNFTSSMEDALWLEWVFCGEEEQEGVVSRTFFFFLEKKKKQFQK